VLVKFGVRCITSARLKVRLKATQMAHTAGGNREALQLVPYLQQEIMCVAIKT
jgi:hypothetical protein